MTGKFRRIILAVKAHHTREAVRALKPHLAEDGTVLSAQNGLNEIIIAEEIGARAHRRLFREFRRGLARTGPHPVRQPRHRRGG